MQVFIRTDASIQIGSGHVMRCITLAKQLLKKNVNVKFICRSLEGNMNEYIIQQGFDVLVLSDIDETLHWDLTGEHWGEDAKETISVIQKCSRSIDMLIVDHYSIDTQWEQKLRPFVKKIMVIDDTANRKHDCDLLLDQNYYLDMESRYNGLVPDKCVRILGPKYVLLREEFLTKSVENLQRDGSVKNILVFFGGTDPTRETLKSLQAIKKLDYPEIKFNIVVGESNPEKKEIEKLCSRMSNVQFHCQVNNMAELMLDANLSIGAGGSTAWERCILQLPTITIIVAQNQKEIAYAVASKGASTCLGESNQVGESEIRNEIVKNVNNPQLVVEMSEKCRSIINLQQVKGYKSIKKIIELLN